MTLKIGLCVFLRYTSELSPQNGDQQSTSAEEQIANIFIAAMKIFQIERLWTSLYYHRMKFRLLITN